MSGDPSSHSSVQDLAELGRVFEEHRARLLGMLERRIDPGLRSRLAPEEILSEVFLRARPRWSAFKKAPTTTPYAWLYGQALDGLIEVWRRETRDCRDLRRDMPLPEGTSLQLGLKIVSPGTSPSEAFARQELREQIQQALALLNEQERQVLLMHHFDGLSSKEVAAILNVKEDTIYQRHHRALTKLSALWQRLHPEAGGEP